MARSRRTAHRFLLRAVVLVSALFGAYQLDRPAFDAAATGWHLLWEPAHRPPDRLYERMRRQFAQAVPAGSRIVVEMPFGGVWPLRIMEFASQHGVHVTGTREDAGYAVSVRYDAAAPYDPDARLVIEPLR